MNSRLVATKTENPSGSFTELPPPRWHTTWRSGAGGRPTTSGARAADHAQARPGLQDRRRHFRLAADHDRAELRNELHQLRLALAGANDDLERSAGGEFFDAALGDRISD